VSTDAIVLLKQDHQEIKKVFRDFQAAGKNATKQKGHLVAKMIELLTVHTYIENEVMYPEVRRLLPDLEDDVLESYEEHHVADLLVFELFTMSADDERFVPKMTVLIENVEHHMGEEEDDWFPKVRDGLGRKKLGELGDRMVELKKTAPRSPMAPKAMKKAFDAAHA
jgi:hemerythrin superfamily protein